MVVGMTTTHQEIMTTRAGDPCRFCGMHVWYDDDLPGFFNLNSRNADGDIDIFFCVKAPGYPNRYTSLHDVD